MIEDREAFERLARAARLLAVELDRLDWVAWAFDPVEGPDAGTWNHDYAADQGAKLLADDLPAAEAEFRAALAAL